MSNPILNRKDKYPYRWYESNPTLLQTEKDIMVENFPNFELGKLDDGRLYWAGELAPGVYETKFGLKKSYYVMAVYQNNHPNQQMGASVYVYPVLPDAEEIMRECGLRLSFLSDSCGEKYLCTTEVKPEPARNTATTAAYALAAAVKWLLTYELMLTGDIPTIEVHPSKFS